MVTARPWLQGLGLSFLLPGDICPSLNCQCSSAVGGLKYLHTYSSDMKGPERATGDHLAKSTKF